MKFRFDINLSEKDYVNFNKFVLTESSYGKKSVRSLRILISILVTVFVVSSLISDGLSLHIVAYLLFFAVAQFGLKPFYKWYLKMFIKGQRKNGKLAFSPRSVIEIYDEYFVEMTDENRNEHKFFGVERVSIVDRKYVYIHINSSMAYIIPFASFESSEQYVAFVNFVKSKCEFVDIY